MKFKNFRNMFFDVTLSLIIGYDLSKIFHLPLENVFYIFSICIAIMVFCRLLKD